MNKLEELIKARDTCISEWNELYARTSDLIEMVMDKLIEQLGGDVSAVEVRDLNEKRPMMRPAPLTWDSDIKMYGIRVVVVLNRLFDNTPEGIEFALYGKAYKHTYWLNVGGGDNPKPTQEFFAETDADLDRHLDSFCVERVENMKRLFTHDFLRQMGIGTVESQESDLSYLGFRGRSVSKGKG